MSDHKINQKMDLGDIIYIIIAFILMIFGFFNKSKQNKEQEKQTKLPKPIPIFPDVESSHHEVNSESYEQHFDVPENIENVDHVAPPSSRPVFQSSMDLITDFKKESSIHPIETTYSKEEQYRMEQTMEEIHDEQHEILHDLLRSDSSDELRRAVLYKEILEPRF